MTTPRYRGLVFDVIEEEDDTWNELRGNVKDAVEAFFFDGPKPPSIRLRLVRDEAFQSQ